MKLVTRTFTTTDIHGASVKAQDGQITAMPLDVISVSEDLSEKAALRLLKKAYPEDNNLVILTLDKRSHLRGMPVEEFFAHSDPIESKTETVEE